MNPEPGPGRRRLVEAVERADLDELVRLIDALCADRDWGKLLELRDRCVRALDRGRQLWPAASHAEYRLALEGSAESVADVLVDGAGRFAPGPLAEVAASTHTWAELSPHLRPGPIAVLAAHERVVRGELVDPASVPAIEVLAVPLAIASWEPAYALATYRSDRVEAPAPAAATAAARGEPCALPTVAPRVRPDIVVTNALRDVVRGWTAGSEGRARVVAVDGGIPDAIAALGARDVRLAEITPGDAAALLAWAGAGGGRHGRRRGAATGRDLAWAAIGALAGCAQPVPTDAEELGAALDELRWYAWAAADAMTGWILRLAVEDRAEGLAWAIDAVDA